MVRPLLLGFAALLLAGCGAAGDSEAAERAAADLDSVERGEELFFDNGCNFCHGDDARGIVASVGAGPSGLASGIIPGPKIAGINRTMEEVRAQLRTPTS